MKLQVEKNALVQSLQKVQNITDKKTNMAILSNVLIKATGDQTLELSATDLELSFWTRLAAQIQEPGNTTVSARKLLEIVRELPQSHIVLETLPNDRVSIHTGRSRFELATIPWEDFPPMSFYEDVAYLGFDASMLRKSLGMTLYGIPAEEDPFSVAGLYLHSAGPDRFRFVSSDGHRLVYVELPKEPFAGLEVGPGIIIPRKGVQETLRILEKEDEVSFGICQNCLMLKTQNSLLSIQLLESEYPEYELIIPDERPFSFTLPSEDLYHALKRMAILTSQKWRHVRFIIRSGLLELESGSQEIGVANEVLDIDYEGEEFSTAFNIRYVLDAIQVIDGPQIRFEWVDQYHGGVFVDPDDPGYLSLIMPMVV